MHHDYELCKSIYNDCEIKIDKIKLFPNLGAKLFQETSDLSGWQELIINDKNIFKLAKFMKKGGKGHRRWRLHEG